MASVNTAQTESAGSVGGKVLGFEEYIDRRLSSTGVQVKLHDFMAAALLAVVSMLAILIVFSVLDAWIVPGGLGTAFRWLGAASWLGIVIWIAARKIAPLLVYRINPLFAARTLEEQAPSLKNQVLNFLLLRGDPRGVKVEVLDVVKREAATGLTGIAGEGSVDRADLIRLGYMLLALTVIAVSYSLLSPKNPFRTAQRILLPWAEIDPPTRVTIASVTPGDAAGFHGDHIPIAAEVENLSSRDRVLLHWTTVDRPEEWSQVSLNPSTSEPRKVSAKLPEGKAGLRTDLLYKITAGDAVTRVFRVKVFAAPTILIEKVFVDYPAYTGLQDQTVERQGDFRAVEGTILNFTTSANQPIKRSWMDFDALPKLELSPKENEAQGALLLRLPKGKEQAPLTTYYQLRFENQAGELNPRPVKHLLEVAPDLPPEIEKLSPKENEVVLAEDEQLQFEWQARDPDFALARADVQLEQEGHSATNFPLLKESQWSGRFVGKWTIVPRDLNLKSGDTVLVRLVVSDNRFPDPHTVESSAVTVRVLKSQRDPQPGEAGEEAPPEQTNAEQKKPDQTQQPGEREQPGDPPPNQRQNPQPRDARNPLRDAQKRQRPDKTDAQQDKPDNGQPAGDQDGQEENETTGQGQGKEGDEQGKPSPNDAQQNDAQQNDKQQNDKQQNDKQQNDKQQNDKQQNDKQQNDKQQNDKQQNDKQQNDKQQNDKQQNGEKQTGKGKNNQKQQGNNASGKPQQGEESQDSQESDPSQVGESQEGQAQDAQQRQQSRQNNKTGQATEKSQQTGAQGAQQSQSNPSETNDASEAADEPSGQEAESEKQGSTNTGDQSAKEPPQKGAAESQKNPKANASQQESSSQTSGENQPAPAKHDGEAFERMQKHFAEQDQNAGRPQQKQGVNSQEKERTGQSPDGQTAPQPPEPANGPENESTKRQRPLDKQDGPGDAAGQGGESEQGTPRGGGGDEQTQGRQGKTAAENGSPKKQAQEGQQQQSEQSGNPPSDLDKSGRDKSAQAQEPGSSNGNQDEAQSGKKNGEPGEGEKNQGSASDESNRNNSSNTQPQNKEGEGETQRSDKQAADQQGESEPSANENQRKQGGSGKSAQGKSRSDQNSQEKQADETDEQSPGHADDRAQKDVESGVKPSPKNAPTNPQSKSDEPNANKSQPTGKEDANRPAGGKNDPKERPSEGQMDRSSEGQKDSPSRAQNEEGADRTNEDGSGEEKPSQSGDEQASEKGNQGKDSDQGNAPSNEEKDAGERGNEKPNTPPSANSSKTGSPNDGSPSEDSERSPESDGGDANSADEQKTSETSDMRPQSKKLPQGKEAPPADAANENFAQQATDLVLERLKEQKKQGVTDEALLKKLGWTPDALAEFVRRWENMKAAANAPGPEGQAAKRELDEALRSLGLSPQDSKLEAGRVRQDSEQGLQQSSRSEPPSKYRESFRAFTRGLLQGNGSGK